jgi:hypothetical protein
MSAMPPAAARIKKKRKKATALAAPAVTSDDASTAMPLPSTNPSHKEGQVDWQEEVRQAHQPLHIANVGVNNQPQESLHCGNCP